MDTAVTIDKITEVLTNQSEGGQSEMNRWFDANFISLPKFSCLF